MAKEFNTEGNCVPGKHYMIDVSKKVEAAFQLIEKGKYFIINRPRQYGKTTTLFLLAKLLLETEEYIPVKLSFEEIGTGSYEKEESFISAFLSRIRKYFVLNQYRELLNFMETQPKPQYLVELGDWIMELASYANKKIVLLIDEVDKSANHQIFLDFLGLLRAKYLAQQSEEDLTFYSVVLAGVHDIKSLKMKIPRQQEISKYNSPWNIAADFEVEMSFSSQEIEGMLQDYSAEKGVSLDKGGIAEKLYFFTSGYPFLVSKLCKIMDEKLMKDSSWDIELPEKAMQVLLQENNTNFETLIKNLENHESLYRMVYDTLIEGTEFIFNIANPDINLGVLYGIFRNEGKLKVHNRIYEQLIYNYLTSNLATQISGKKLSLGGKFLTQEGSLDFEQVLLKFQAFMQEQYSEKDAEFIERNGRLIFLAFLKPIINGKGFDFKEVEISEERRLDVTVTYLNQKFVAELKIWRGEAYHQEGIEQLVDYMSRVGIDQGYLLIFDKTKGKIHQGKQDRIQIQEKDIFMVWV